MTNPHQSSWAFSIWEKAEAAEDYLKITFKEKKDAEACRFALYTARTQSRKESTEIYQPGDLEYGKSPWDIFRITIKPAINGHILLITRHAVSSLGDLDIEVV